MIISDHFTLAELTKSSTATRLGIDNTPDHEAILKLKVVAKEILEPCRYHYGKSITPSSAFRCIELNRAIRSKDTSQHVKGEAIDFEVAGVSNMELFNWIKDNLEFDQLILEFYDGVDPHSGWVHVSYSEGNNRNQAFSIG